MLFCSSGEVNVYEMQASSDIKLNTNEIRDLTRMERIGAHSHIRGINTVYFLSHLFVLRYLLLQVWVLTMLWSLGKSLKEWLDKRLLEGQLV